MENFSSHTQLNKTKLEEITQKIENEDVSTDDLLNLLEDAVNIGMAVCTQAQNNIDQQISQDLNASDEQR